MKKIYTIPEKSAGSLSNQHFHQFTLKWIIAVLLLSWNSLVHGASITTGATNANTGTNVTGYGTVAWNNPGNIVSNNTLYATVGLSGGAISNYLQATNYGFGIPTGATINGIVVTIERYESNTGSGNDVRDNVVKLIKGGSVVGNNKANTSSDWPTSPTVATYGTTSDLWGTTWTAADINASNFGVALAATSSNARTGYVDYMQISVTYTATYLSSFVSMNTGTSQWCAGETRTVTVTVKNNGSVTWTDGAPYPDVNIGVKWNADPDYLVRTDAGGLVAGGTQTYSFSVTAPSAGTNNLTFDVVKEGDCWFGNNNGSCGPGNSVYASPTITIVSTVPAQPSTITGSGTPCVGSSQTYSVTNVSGVTYNWTFPSGWTQTAGGTTNSVTVTVGSTTGNVQVTPNNACGNGTARTLAVTPTTVPAQPSAISGSTTPCQASTQTYSVTNIAGVTYAWSMPSGWTGTSTTNSITVTVGATSGTVQVTPSNACGNGTAQTLAVTVTTLPAQPSTITGNSSPCQGSSQTYSVTNVSGVTYNWTFPSGWTQTGGGTTNSVTVTVGTTSGNITVTPATCGNGTARTLAVTTTTLPAQPSAITGSTTPCIGSSTSYSVTSVSGVTYNWTLPSGWVQTGGGTTNSITVTVGSGIGNIQVTPSNSCGTGSIQTLAVTPTTIPAQPSVITGNINPCEGSSQTYTVTNVSGVTYTWVLPSGWTGTSSTNSITATVGATSGNVQVTPSNACGNGTTQLLAVSVNLLPSSITVSGGGVQCDQATLTASGGSGGTIYFQGTTSGGTSTATPSSMQVVTSSGTYYFRAQSTAGCWGAEGSATVTINASPVTQGTTICQGTSGELTSSTICPTLSNQTSGPMFAGTGGSSGSGTVWSNPGRIIANDNSNTTVSGNGTGFSQMLNATNFGFALPSDAVINGIQVIIGRYASGGFLSYIQDYTVRLLKAGTALGDNKASTSANWPTSETAVYYGSNTDLWGTTWQVSDINSSSFGVALGVSSTVLFGNPTANVDYFQITITYTLNGVLYWYTSSSGGSPIGSGTPFNPVGIPGSPLTNTNTPGTTTFYAECSTVPGCRTSTDFIVSPAPTPSINGPSGVCQNAIQTYTTEGGMGGYVWTITGGTGSSTTNTIDVQWGSGSSGNVSVTFTSPGCGQSTPNNLPITIIAQPSAYAGTDGTVNQGNPYTVAGASASGNVVWTSSGPGTLSNETTLAPTYTPQPNETAAVLLTISVTGTGNCTATDDMLITFIPLTATWNGFSFDNDWHSPYNWNEEAVPGTITNVIIPGDLFGNYPIITSPAVCNNITLESDASLIEYGNLTVNGQAYVKREIANDWKWHFLSSPVQNQPIWPEFASTPAGSPLTFGSAPWYFDFYYWNPNTAPAYPALPWVNIRKSNGEYNDAAIDQAGDNAGFGAAVPVMATGRGYLVAYTNGWKPGSPTTHTFSGSLNSGSYSIPVTLNDPDQNKFNLVGNPYPSSIDWQAVSGWDRSYLNLNGTGYDYWIWNDAAGVYGAFNSGDPEGSGTNNADRYIAPTQAFFVKAYGSGSLVMDDGVRAHSLQPWLKKTDASNSYLRLKLSSPATVYTDELVVIFNPQNGLGGTDKWWSFYAEAPAIYSVKDDRNLCIDRYAGLDHDLVVNVNTAINVAGTYTITASNIADFSLSSKVLLEDKKTGTVTDLKQKQSYAFDGTPGDDQNRFRLIIGSPIGIEETKTNDFTIYVVDNVIKILNDKITEPYTVTVTNILGQILFRNVLAPNSMNEIPVGRTPGVYVVNVISKGQTYSKKVVIGQ